MGMIFQSAALFDSLSVLENVMFPLDMFSNDTYRDRVKRAQFCLDRVNLIDAQSKYPGEISGGMQKRVWLLHVPLLCSQNICSVTSLILGLTLKPRW